MNYKRLFFLYPEAFKNTRGIDFSKSPESRFECAEGWSKIIEPIMAYLHDFNTKNPDSPITISQVKEKMGTLRFYTSTTTDELSDLIDKAESQSETSCEVCGNPATTEQQRGWLSTLCPLHRKN